MVVLCLVESSFALPLHTRDDVCYAGGVLSLSLSVSLSFLSHRGKSNVENGAEELKRELLL